MSKEKNVPKLRFPEFTDAWKQRKLGEVLDDMYNGQTPSRNRSEFWKGNISWLSSGELNRGIVSESIETITEEGQKSANLRMIPKGTFVMAITGLEAAGTRGNCAILGFDTTLNQSCMALFPKKDMLTSEFLFQWYRKVGEEYGINYTQGTKQQSYNAEIIKILPISIPKIEEQKKIATYLSNLDNLITLHQRKCEVLKEYKSGMLQKMFPREGQRAPEIRFPGFSDAWEQRKFPEFVEFYNGLTYTPGDVQESGTLVLRSSNVKNGEIADADNVYVNPEIATSENVRKGDIIVVVRNGSRALIGKHAEIKESMPNTVIGAFMTGIRSEHPSFVNALLGTAQFEKEIEKNMGATINQITGYMFSKMEFMIPGDEEQEAIGKYFKEFDNLITLHQHKCEELKKYKKGLLQQMFV